MEISFTSPPGRQPSIGQLRVGQCDEHSPGFLLDSSDSFNPKLWVDLSACLPTGQLKVEVTFDLLDYQSKESAAGDDRASGSDTGIETDSTQSPPTVYRVRLRVPVTDRATIRAHLERFLGVAFQPKPQPEEDRRPFDKKSSPRSFQRL